jgi:hypothetical protein
MDLLKQIHDGPVSECPSNFWSLDEFQVEHTSAVRSTIMGSSSSSGSQPTRSRLSKPEEPAIRLAMPSAKNSPPLALLRAVLPLALLRAVLPLALPLLLKPESELRPPLPPGRVHPQAAALVVVLPQLSVRPRPSQSSFS